MSRAYKDSGGALQTGSTVSTMSYDGLGRRISQAVSNSGDLDATYHYYYDGQSLIETRNGSDLVLKQHVWANLAGGYIDELVQIAVNDDPADGTEDACEDRYWALADANYNVLGLVDAAGVLVERYQYTPYGERTVYLSPGSNDPAAHAPTLMSRRVEISGVAQPYGLNSIGHQGLVHDEATGLVYNRARHLHPRLGRFITRDPGGYIDGPNLYQYLRSNPLSGTDPTGLFKVMPGVHQDITRSGYGASTPPSFREFETGIAEKTYLEEVIHGNKSTDLSFSFFNKAKHATNIGFVDVMSKHMELIRTAKCTGDHADANARDVLYTMGTALHTLQDFYTHTDWLDGWRLQPVYEYYGDGVPEDLKPGGDKTTFYARAASHAPRTTFDTVDLSTLKDGKKGPYKDLIYFTGGSLGDLKDDPHQRYAADMEGFGRSRPHPEGLGSGAFVRAKGAAFFSTRDFFVWSEQNMTPSCHCVIYGE